MENQQQEQKIKVKKTQDIKQYQKEYREKNKDKIKNYYEEWINKPENNPLQQIECCECGAKTVKSSISKHRKTKKCIKSRQKNDYECFTLEEL